MFIQYGADPTTGAGGIDLSVVETREHSREAVLSEPQTGYNYTKLTLDVVAAYNPQMVSYRAGAVPLQLAGQLPANTDKAIRHTLSQPRKLLRFQSGVNEVIRSPLAGATVDCNNGPIVERCDIIRAHGFKTWLVRFRVVTWIHECATPPLALTHTFRKYMDTDQDYFSFIVTEGEARFNTARLVAGGFEPDDFRREFNHEIPNECRRDKIEVIPDAAGTSVKYRFVDRETAFHLGKTAECVRCEAYHTFQNQRAGWKRAASSAISSAGIGTLLSGILGGGGIGIVGRLAVSTLAGTAPKYYEHVLVRMWGTKIQDRFDMMRRALALTVWRLGPFIAATDDNELIITHDISGKFVEVNMTKRYGPEGILGGIAGALAPSLENQIRGAFSAEAHDVFLGGFGAAGAGETVFGLPADGLFRAAPIGNPPPPFNAGSRGTLLVRLVHQALANACEAVPQGSVASRTLDVLSW